MVYKKERLYAYWEMKLYQTNNVHLQSLVEYEDVVQNVQA